MVTTVLGASGFIGSRLLRSLRDCGREVYAPPRGAPEIFEKELGHVVYAIGLTADFRNHPYETAEAHVGYLVRILREAHFSSITYLSSTRVYQGAESGSEESVLRVFPDADGLYNLTKLTGEALCLQSGRGRVARLSNVIGEGASESFVAQLVAAAAAGHIHLRSSQASAKDYILIDDAVRALSALASDGDMGIYNVASGRNTTTAEIINALSTCWDFDLSVAEGAETFTFPVLDTSRIGQLLPWQPQSVAAWLRCRKNGQLPL